MKIITYARITNACAVLLAVLGGLASVNHLYTGGVFIACALLISSPFPNGMRYIFGKSDRPVIPILQIIITISVFVGGITAPHIKTLSDNQEIVVVNDNGGFDFNKDVVIEQLTTLMAQGEADEVITTPRLLEREFGTEVVRDFSHKPGFFESMKTGLIKHTAALIFGLNNDEINQMQSMKTMQQYPISMHTTLPTIK